MVVTLLTRGIHLLTTDIPSASRDNFGWSIKCTVDVRVSSNCCVFLCSISVYVILFVEQ